MNGNNQGNPSQPRLAEVCREIFQLAVLLSSTSQYGEPAALRARIKKSLDSVEANANQLDLPESAVQSAKFALVAFLDETLLTSSWEQRDVWMSKTLAFELFNRLDAGEQFYFNLEELRRDHDTNKEVLEVYYLCLTLGFKGKLVKSPDEHQKLVKDLSQKLEKNLKIEAGPLSPPVPLQPQSAPKQSDIPVWVIVGSAGAIGLIYYAVMLLLSWGS